MAVKSFVNELAEIVGVAPLLDDVLDAVLDPPLELVVEVVLDELPQAAIAMPAMTAKAAAKALPLGKCNKVSSPPVPAGDGCTVRMDNTRRWGQRSRFGSVPEKYVGPHERGINIT